MRRVILSSVTRSAVPYSSTLSHKRHDFRENIIGHKKCVLIYSTTFVWNISHYKNNSPRYYHKCAQVFKWSTPYSCHIWLNWSFLDRFSEKKPPQIQNFMKFSPAAAELFNAEGRTGMTKQVVAFENFPNAPKKPLNQHEFASQHLIWY